MNPMTGANVLLEYLEQENVEYVFGIPGGPIIPLYEALYARGRIKPVLVKHEEGAAFMADGYARASGRIGVCCTTTGPGATNALTGIAVSHVDHVPVLLLTAQVATHQFGKGAFQESSPEVVDLVSLFKPVTKWSTMVHHPSRIGASMRMALRTMRSGRPGPVHLSIPLDYISQPVEEEILPPPSFRCESGLFDRRAVKESSERLLRARAPIILAGSGVNHARAWPELRALAERHRIPVATSFKAKGCFPENHPLSLGVLGPSGHPAVREYVLGPDTDMVLVIGSSLGEVSSCGYDPRLSRKLLLQIDIDPCVIGRNFPVTVGLVGDARAILVEMLYETERRLRMGSAATRRRPDPPAELKIPDDVPVSGSGLQPQEVLRELREALPHDVMLFVDNGSIRSWVGQYFPIYKEDSFFVNMGLASMGYAVAGCVGAQLARPDRQVVCLSGDASFAMNGMEVHTAVENDAPVVWIVINNGGHGMIYHGERAIYGGRFCSSIFRRAIDVCAVARGLGADGIRVEHPGELADALAEARASRRPTVIDVITELGAPPPMGARVSAIRSAVSIA
jgi:acetolactate synthase-1/2/3 large subunit